MVPFQKLIISARAQAFSFRSNPEVLKGARTEPARSAGNQLLPV